MGNQRRVLLSTALVFCAAAVLPAQEILNTLRVSVDVVLVNVTVTDSRNETVTGLDQEDFELFEDKVQQDIRYFSNEDAPVSLGVIFDASGSMDEKAAFARDAAISFLKTSTREDEFFLVQFSDYAWLTQDFTTNVSRVESRLASLRTQGSTALYDALYLGLTKVSSGLHSRKALLLITDGVDNHSRYSRGDIRRFLREADVQVYSIDLGRALIGEFSEITGGHSYRTSVNGLWETSRKIAAEMKNQYVLGYVSSNTTKDGTWRKIRVKVDPAARKGRLSVRAKDGYYAN
jgi:Ca-activated chloride channel homolog